MTAAETALREELESKVRYTWELNGYKDGLVGHTNRVPEGRKSVRDTYLVGWRDGDQVRLMRAALQEAESR
jgi:ribosome modulation factor